jgi:hypothetical protein
MCWWEYPGPVRYPNCGPCTVTEPPTRKLHECERGPCANPETSSKGGQTKRNMKCPNHRDEKPEKGSDEGQGGAGAGAGTGMSGAQAGVVKVQG